MTNPTVPKFIIFPPISGFAYKVVSVEKVELIGEFSNKVPVSTVTTPACSGLVDAENGSWNGVSIPLFRHGSARAVVRLRRDRSDRRTDCGDRGDRFDGVPSGKSNLHAFDVVFQSSNAFDLDRDVLAGSDGTEVRRRPGDDDVPRTERHVL